MGLTRIDVLKKINTYSMTNNKMGLIQILCEIIENEEFLLNNIDIVQIAIESGELYGYNEYLKKYKEKLQINDIDSTNSVLRKIMFTSLYDKNVVFNSGQLSLLEEIIQISRDNIEFLKNILIILALVIVYSYVIILF